MSLDLILVGAEGFEPPTLCSQSRCATRLRYAPTFYFDCIANGILAALVAVARCMREHPFADRPGRCASFDATIDRVYGGYSSAAERLTVAQDVVGSIPTSRPNLLLRQQPNFLDCRASVTPEISENTNESHSARICRAGSRRLSRGAASLTATSRPSSAIFFPARLSASPVAERSRWIPPTAAACSAIVTGSRNPRAYAPHRCPGSWSRGFVGLPIHAGHCRARLGCRLQRRPHEHAQLRRY